jgi:PPOX class probable F420-dependent enzyme
MSTLTDPEVKNLLDNPNYAVVSTHNEDGSILSTIIWVGADDEKVELNSAVGRRWPTNLERDPRVTVLVYEANNPYNYVEIRGTATSTTEGADEHIDGLAKKYLGQDEYPFRQPSEQRIRFDVEPSHVRHQKQG